MTQVFIKAKAALSVSSNSLHFTSIRFHLDHRLRQSCEVNLSAAEKQVLSIRSGPIVTTSLPPHMLRILNTALRVWKAHCKSISARPLHVLTCSFFSLACAVSLFVCVGYTSVLYIWFGSCSCKCNILQCTSYFADFSYVFHIFSQL